MTAMVDGKLEDPSKIAHLVELGTRPHSLSSGSKLRRGLGGVLQRAAASMGGKLHPGARAQPALIPAKLQTGRQVIDLMTGILTDGIEAAAKGVA
jgi:hypothetical protein